MRAPALRTALLAVAVRPLRLEIKAPVLVPGSRAALVTPAGACGCPGRSVPAPKLQDDVRRLLMSLHDGLPNCWQWKGARDGGQLRIYGHPYFIRRWFRQIHLAMLLRLLIHS